MSATTSLSTLGSAATSAVLPLRLPDAEDVFEGPAVELPEPIQRSRALYRRESVVQPPVRHARGYTPFVAFCREQDVDAK